MKKLKYEDNTGDWLIIELEDDNQVEECVKAELETAKREFKKNNIVYVLRFFYDGNGKNTEICSLGRDKWIRWTRA